MTPIDPTSVLPAGVPIQLPIDREPPAESEAAVAKARYIIQLLRDANLKFEFGFTVDSAEQTWAALLAPYSTLLLEDAVREFIQSSARTAPTPGEISAVARQIIRQRAQEKERVEKAAASESDEPTVDPEYRDWILGRHTMKTHDQAGCDHE